MTDYLERLEARLRQIAPDNTAEFPIALTKTKTEHGYVWIVDISIVAARAEYSLEARDPDPTQALRKAWISLNSHEARARDAAHAELRLRFKTA